jgi:hypothetical protein
MISEWETEEIGGSRLDLDFRLKRQAHVDKNIGRD